MKFSLLDMTDLDPALTNRWEELRQTSELYASPYYSPEFTRIVGQNRSDARLLVCEDAGVVTGFLPFHQRRFKGMAIGEFLSDYQGPISLEGTDLPLHELLKSMQVPYFGFNHMPDERRDFSKFAWTHSRSQILDLSDGFDAYCQVLAQREGGVLKKTARLESKLAREHGALRFCMDNRNRDDFLALLRGKSEQFLLTLGPGNDIFSQAWVRSVVEAIYSKKNRDFSGMLSTLHAGDTLVAAHFGMRSKNVLHYWFPWYLTDFSAYSPGLILLMKCAMEAGTHGINSIDLGRGEQAYKLRFASYTRPLCEGAISNPDFIRATRAFYFRAKSGLRNSALGARIRNIKNTAN